MSVLGWVNYRVVGVGLFGHSKLGIADQIGDDCDFDFDVGYGGGVVVEEGKLGNMLTLEHRRLDGVECNEFRGE